jgi:hypothetical protein
MNACEKGEVCELNFAAAARERGFRVFLPVGHSGAVDMVILHEGQSPRTVQIKKAQHDPGYARYKCTLRRRKFATSRSYRKGDFDVLAMAAGDHGFIFYPIEEIAGSKSVTWYPDRSRARPWNWEILE